MKRIRLIDAAGKDAGNYDIENDGHPHAAVHVNGRLFTLEPAAGLDPPAVRTYRACDPPNVARFAEVKDELELTDQQRRDPQQQRQDRAGARVQTTEHNAGEKTGSDREVTADEDAEGDLNEALLEKTIEESKSASAEQLAQLDVDIRGALANAKNAGDLLPLWAAAYDARTSELKAA